ncbi:MAG: TlyA family RNA methyltransferase [Patescibacteria group bacterium]
MPKQRLDDILITRGQAKNRENAFVLITSGRVLANGQKAVSGSQMIPDGAHVDVRGLPPNVGRGAEKLAYALNSFHVSPDGKICLDVGAATGGFTQVLLQRGAKKVYAVDTTRGKLADIIRRDPRVIVMEKTDIRDVISLQDAIDVIAIDVSLVSLRHILAHLARAQFFTLKTIVLALFKPQYETRDPAHLRGGIIRNDDIRDELLRQFTGWLRENHWTILRQTPSPIRGSKGNIEYLFYLTLKENLEKMAQ